MEKNNKIMFLFGTRHLACALQFADFFPPHLVNNEKKGHHVWPSFGHSADMKTHNVHRRRLTNAKLECDVCDARSLKM